MGNEAPDYSEEIKKTRHLLELFLEQDVIVAHWTMQTISNDSLASACHARGIELGMRFMYQYPKEAAKVLATLDHILVDAYGGEATGQSVVDRAYATHRAEEGLEPLPF